MSALPGLALAFLEALLPPSAAGPLVGDLAEEFALLEARSPGAARRWLLSQVARSVPYAVGAAFRATPLPVVVTALAGATVAAAAATAASSALWRWVLFHVPYRAGHAPPLTWLAACGLFTAGSTLLFALIGARAGRFLLDRRSR